MTPQNHSESPRSFDPSRDIDDYLVDDGRELRQRGLQKQSIRFYELLCRLCLPGESQLVYQLQDELIADLKRLAPGEAGLTEGSVSRKFSTLAKLGFACKSGGGQSGCPLIVDLLLPDQVELKPPRPRRPTVQVTPSDERQGQLFDGGGPFRVVRASEETESEPKTFALRSVETENVFGFESDRHTSYPRTRVGASAVDDEVEDEDESTGEILDFDYRDPNQTEMGTSAEQEASAVDVTSEQLDRAIHEGLLTAWRRWGRHDVRFPKPAKGDRDRPHESNFSMILRAHVAVQLGRLSEDWFWGGVDAVLLQRQKERIKNPFAFLYTDWKSREPNAGKVFSAHRIRLPPGWYERTRTAFPKPKE